MNVRFVVSVCGVMKGRFIFRFDIRFEVEGGSFGEGD